MRIDNEYNLEVNALNVTLVKQKKRVHTKGEYLGTPYDSREEWYYSSVKRAMQGYLDKRLMDGVSHCSEVVDLIKEVERLEEYIKGRDW